MHKSLKTARDVSEYLLHHTGHALKTGDFDTFQRYFCLPLVIETFEGSQSIRNAVEFKTTFDAVRAHFQKLGVTDMIRHCVEAEFTNPHEIVATHETRLVSGTVIVQDPFPVLSVLRFTGADWSIFSSSYAIEDRSEHNAALMAAGKTLTKTSP